LHTENIGWFSRLFTSMRNQYFLSDVSAQVWESKYRWCETDATIADTWRRVARALASVEPTQQAEWQARFYSVLENFRFLPGGRIQAGAGTGRRVTLFNCFVMGTIADSMDGIFDALKQGAITMQQGGGVGYDFSTLRPAGMRAESVGSIASGPVSFMRIWDSMCGTILSTGARRGAMMATLRCDHPDIGLFIDAKREAGTLKNFNLSVLVSDAFMHAIEHDEDWPLIFPTSEYISDYKEEFVVREWPGYAEPVRCQAFHHVSARTLWQKILRANYDYAEPGVLFIDSVQRANNLHYCEHISATNPCGEIPLPPYGACDLGSINLTQFVREPFTSAARMDLDAIADTAALAVRMLDNVYELSRFPLPQQAETARASRRIGLGITGLADALIMLGEVYGSDISLKRAEEIMRTICYCAYRTSIELAREKGAFSQFDTAKYLRGEFIRALPPDIFNGIAAHGLRNSHLMAIAPTGTISLLANNVSSGLEPVFALDYQRNLVQADGSTKSVNVIDYSCSLYRRMHGQSTPLPPQFVTSAQVSPAEQLAMQASLQRYVDNAISKTLYIPQAMGFDDFRSVFDQAYKLGLKGCTAYRPNPVRGSMMQPAVADSVSACCETDVR
jgi:ribonucleoside-diphosphate reductase alpha chain